MVNEENVELNKILLLKSFTIPDNERHLITMYTTLKCFTYPYASITNKHLPDIVCLDHLQARVLDQVHALPYGGELSPVQKTPVNKNCKELTTKQKSKNIVIRI